MKTTQKKPVKIDLSHSLCKKTVGGVGTSKGDSPKGNKAEPSKQEKQDGLLPLPEVEK